MNPQDFDYLIDKFNIEGQNLNRGYLLTEKSNLKSKELDTLGTLELVQIFSDEDLEPQKAVKNSIKDIAFAIDRITEQLKVGGRLFYIGAGTSGRLGVLDASECPPTFNTSPEIVQGIIAGGHESLYKSSETLEDDTNLAIADLKSRDFNYKDCLIGITAGGTTPYVHSGLEYSSLLNALSIFICCVPKDQVQSEAEIDIRLLTGPEIISGSTRLKAGTATKMVLNIISSCVMIKLGKVYSNYMIDLSATNLKLIDRSIRIIMDLADIDFQKAKHYLKEAKGSVKIALLMTLADLDFKIALDYLSRSNGNLRQALKLANL